MKQQHLSGLLDEPLIDLKTIILLNLAAVRLKKKEHREAIKFCNEVGILEKS